MSASSASAPDHEHRLLAAARAGDESAYGRLVEPHRTELQAHCYRMLGSIQDAEDALQDALIRAWRALPRFEGRSTVRAWLYRIATNTCLDLVRRRPKRVVPLDHGPESDATLGPGAPLSESIWIEPFPDERLQAVADSTSPDARYEARESVELAFIAVLQHLPARQRAALLLHEVLGYSASEVADALETTVASVNSLLQRARRSARERMPERSQQQTLRAMGDDDLRALVDTYVDAWERGDVDGIRNLLADDAAITMPPMATWFRGDGLLTFLTDWAFNGRVYDLEGRRKVRVLPTTANGQPALGTYAWSDEHGELRPTVLQVLTFSGTRIQEITGFVSPHLFARFGLPESLPG